MPLTTRSKRASTPKPPTATPARAIGPDNGFVRVRGAREHNLKDVDLDVPRDRLVVFSGVSGSGKSSLAFGTIYAEAQRRYFESVAPYARRLIDQAGVPDVDSIEGLPPAIALQQQRGASNARSSVGSVTTLSIGSKRHGRPALVASSSTETVRLGSTCVLAGATTRVCEMPIASQICR